jgi:outer membrane protein assembly factor BamB
MALRTLLMALSCTALAAGSWGEVTYEVDWRVPSQGGFSAPNLFRDTKTGAPLLIVTTDDRVGVVCLGLDGTIVWQHEMELPVSSPVAVADLDGDGREDVVAGDSVGNVVALTQDGEPMWTAIVPGRIQAESCFTIADLDNDGDLETLIGDTTGSLSCLDRTGRLLWRFQGQGTRMAIPLVADIYDAPGNEIIIGSHDQHIYALAANGEWIWDLYFDNDLFPNSTPILADVDGDHTPELYIGGGLNHFYRIDLAKPSVVVRENVFLHINSAIAAADIDRDGKDEIVFGNKTGAAWCYDDDAFAWNIEFQHSTFYSAPVFVNLDDDPALEILVHSASQDLQFVDTDGSVLREQIQTGLKVIQAPLVGDFDGDGMMELLVAQGMSGGALAWVELGIPWQEEPGVATSFAGGRGNTGRTPAGDWDPLPTPKLVSGVMTAAAEPVDAFKLLSGPNQWRVDVDNPDQERLVLLLDLEYPDGSVRRFAKHVMGPAGRVVLPFDIAEAGKYASSMRLVNAETLTAMDTADQVLAFKGFATDREYLRGVLSDIEETLVTWNASNPQCAGAIRTRLLALRGMLTEVAREDNGGRVTLTASLIKSAERLRAIATAGAALAPSGTFFAWEFCPWAYFNEQDSLPTPADRTEKLEAALCVEEYESIALNLTNATDTTLGVRALCDSLKRADAGPDAEAIPAMEHIELRQAVTVPAFRREMVSDALPKLNQAHAVKIPPLETQQLWITVNAKGLKPGAYIADLRIKSLEPDPTEVVMPIELTVYDLALPRPRPLAFCMWAYDGGDMGTDNPAVLRELVEHGMTVFFGQSPRAQADAEGNLIGALDFTATDESIERLSPHGIMLFIGPQGQVGGVPFLSEPWRKAFIAYLRAWVAHMKELGLDYHDWALYPYDEPSTPFTETTLNLVKVAKVVREADPNILIYTDPTSGTTMETVDMLRDFIDIWCPSAELLERLGDDLVPVAKEVGTFVWYYDAPGRSKTLSPLGHYRPWMWYAWNMGFTGAGWWVFGLHGPDRWEGPNPAGNFFATAYDCPGGVVTSRRWESTREAIEDYEYLYLLREAIINAEARGVPADKLAQAKELITTVPLEVESTLRKLHYRLPLTPDSVPVFERTNEMLEDVRVRIVEACLAVKAM